MTVKSIYTAVLKIQKRASVVVMFALAVLLSAYIGYMMKDYYVSILILILIIDIFIGELQDLKKNSNIGPLLDAATIFVALSVLPTILELFYHSAALISGKVDEINTPSHLYLCVMCIVTLLFLLAWILEKKKQSRTTEP